MDEVIGIGSCIVICLLAWKIIRKVWHVATQTRRTKTPSSLSPEVAMVLRELARLEEATDGNGFPLFEAGVLPDRLDDGSLCSMAARMAHHIGLGDISFGVEYVAFEEGTAGQIRWPDGEVKSPTIYVGQTFAREPNAAIKILAHELAHEYRHVHGLVVESEDNVEEPLTDVTSVYLGFGKYILNGAVTDADVMPSSTYSWRTSTTGYIKPVCFAYVYDLICHLRGLTEAELQSGLNIVARNDLRQSRWTGSFVMPPLRADRDLIGKKIANVQSVMPTLERSDKSMAQSLERVLDEINADLQGKPETSLRLLSVIWLVSLNLLERQLSDLPNCR